MVSAASSDCAKANCSACHQADGSGLPGAFPPLAQSDYLEGDRKQVLSAALFGLSGPITVNGVDYNAVMPNLCYLSDREVADIVTYVMHSWDNPGGEVTAESVAAIRRGEAESDPAGGRGGE